MIKNPLIIIGGGIGGLAAGCYAQMNGYQSKIFEMHTLPGGFCTAWKRKGYTFDYCIHDLAGAGANSSLHHVWQELGALEETPLIHFDEFWRVENMDGKPLMGYCDIDHLELHLLAHSPQDSRLITQYLRGIKNFQKFELFSIQEGGAEAYLNTLAHLSTLVRWSRVNMGSFARRFKDPFLREAFPYFQYGAFDTPLSVHMNFVANVANQKFAWPSGGSLEFAKRIAARYEALGGEIHYKSKVEEVLVEEDRAVGVRLADGSYHNADRVISTADGMYTIYTMLNGMYTNRFIDEYYKNPPDDSTMSLIVSLGVRREMKDEPRAITLLLDEPLYIGDRMRQTLDIEILAYEPEFSPPGCTSIRVLMDTAYAPWARSYQDHEKYETDKQVVAEDVISVLEKRFPGIREQVEVIDVATPVTVERYTGNYRGHNAWLPKKDALRLMVSGISRTLPGLNNFYMAGQWASMAVGLHSTAISGRKLIQRLCKEDERQFTIE